MDRKSLWEKLYIAGESLSPLELAEKIMAPAMEEIGNGWETGRFALAQVYMAGRIAEEVMDKLLPPGGPPRKDQPRMAIATLEDYHLLGRRMVWSVIRSGGYLLEDYQRVSVDEVVEFVERDRIEVLLLSTLMLPAALRVSAVREKLNRRGLNIKLVVGGAPFRYDRDLWRSVGADATGYDASAALAIVKQWAGDPA